MFAVALLPKKDYSDVQDHPGLPASALAGHVQPVKCRTLYLALPAVALEVKRGSGQACFEGEASIGGFP
ncbi:MAG: hypothetical protein QOI57_937, partial [Rubrobacteraceae bacterium]|nr:hypothetical protein [Rubrobacteraceae bacterium]